MLDNKVDQQAMRSPLHFMKGQRSKFLNDGDVGLTITEISDSCYLNLRGKFDDANFVEGIDGVLNLELPIIPGTFSANDLETIFCVTTNTSLSISCSLFFHRHSIISSGILSDALISGIPNTGIYIILFIFLRNKRLFNFNYIFWKKFSKIIFASVIMGIFFNYLILLFENQLSYDYQFKSFYLIFCVFLGLVFYLLLCYFIKAFNSKDLKLKY